MLVDFTVENFRSYFKAKTFSLAASTARERPQNLFEVEGQSLVRAAAIYGANASGKSNLLEAMNVLGELLTRPPNRSFMEDVDVPAFALDKASGKRPSRFSLRFFLDQVRFDYGIAVSNGLIQEEYLNAYPLGRKQEWFVRAQQEITINSTHLKGPKEKLKQVTPEDMPFLAIAGALGHP